MTHKTHWKSLVKPDAEYLGCQDFAEGTDIIATIKSVGHETVTGTNGKKDDKAVIRFKENIKPLILNATNSKTIRDLFKTPYVEEWIGRKIQLYPDLSVKFAKEVTGGVRIRPFIPKDKSEKPKCFDCKCEIVPLGDKTAEFLAEYTQKKYGKPLCPECAKKVAEAALKDEKGVL